MTDTERITLPELNVGEHYAGILLDKKGRPSHHVILLPGDLNSATWGEAKAFAEKAGGDLPTRREQSLLFANVGGQFKPEWYWSGEEHAAADAWGQLFSGIQSYWHKVNKFRARAVRRVPIRKEDDLTER